MRKGGQARLGAEGDEEAAEGEVVKKGPAPFGTEDARRRDGHVERCEALLT